MSFIVEDGTGVPDANSYASVVFADSYFLDRNETDWALLTEPEKQAALIKGTDYIEQLYCRRFIGDMTTVTQPLSWPRINTDVYSDVGFPDNEIPLRLQKATVEYAKRSLTVVLLPDPVVDATGFSVVTTRKAVGPIEKEFRPVAGRSTPSLVRPYPAADIYMRGLLVASSGGVIR